MTRNSHNNGFHESYYDHACRVNAESDILDIHFKEVALFSSCMKKWYDLFLLSYSDDRAVDFYHSTHAMRMGRACHYRRHMGSIHPFSKFRNFWDMFILHVVILHQILVYLNITVLLQSVPIITCYIAMLLEVFIILDIFINARTGFVNRFNRKVELDRRLVLINYCSKKLFFHVASAIPLACIMFLRYGTNITCTVCKANNFSCVISFITIINVFRVYELSLYYKQEKATATKGFFNFLRIGVNITFFTIQLVHYSDTFSLIHLMSTGKIASSTYNDSFFPNIFHEIHRTPAKFKYTRYVNAQLWRVVNLFAVPRFGLLSGIYPHHLMWFITYSILCICNIWLILEIFYFLNRDKYFDDEIYKSERYLSKLVKSRELPNRFHLQMKEYVHFTATKMRVMELKNGLIKSLPKNLKNEMAWQSFSRSILRIPYFNDWPKEVIEKMVFLIEEYIYLENDVIVQEGVSGNGLMIVDAGLLGVYKVHNSKYKEVEHLIDGDYFGQHSLVTDREVSTTSVVAITKCKILLLEKILFRQLMRSFPDLFYALRNELEKELLK